MLGSCELAWAASLALLLSSVNVLGGTTGATVLALALALDCIDCYCCRRYSLYLSSMRLLMYVLGAAERIVIFLDGLFVF